jgi:hypothetical protein
MAHLWIHSEAGWKAERLVAPFFDVGSLRAIEPHDEWGPSDEDGDGPDRAGGAGFARLVRVEAAGVGTWALIASPGFAVRLNGRTPPAGLSILTDRDEIRFGPARHFFSRESPAVVEPFPGGETAIFCGRCRQRIEKGASSVRCPGCGVWYDQARELPCWTYAQKCVFCETLTALDDEGLMWIPEE